MEGRMQQHTSKYFASDTPPPTLGWGQKVKFNFLSEYGHVTYQIKRNDTCSNMVADILISMGFREGLCAHFFRLVFGMTVFVSLC